MTETPNRNWMSPLNRIKWRSAIVNRKTSVTVDDGRVFVLDYSKRPGKVHYYPKGAETLGVPRGWLDIKTVEKERGDWIVS